MAEKKTGNVWEDLVQNERASMADRIEAFKALTLERNAQAANRSSNWTAPAHRRELSEAEQKEAIVVAPEIMAQLEEEERLYRYRRDFEKSPLMLFALGYGTELRADGSTQYGHFAYIVNSLVRPRARAIERKPIEYQQIQRKGGTLAEMLYLLRKKYIETYGGSMIPAKANLVKADK